LICPTWSVHTRQKPFESYFVRKRAKRYLNSFKLAGVFPQILLKFAGGFPQDSFFKTFFIKKDDDQKEPLGFIICGQLYFGVSPWLTLNEISVTNGEAKEFFHKSAALENENNDMLVSLCSEDQQHVCDFFKFGLDYMELHYHLIDDEVLEEVKDRHFYEEKVEVDDPFVDLDDFLIYMNYDKEDEHDKNALFRIFNTLLYTQVEGSLTDIFLRMPENDLIKPGFLRRTWPSVHNIKDAFNYIVGNEQRQLKKNKK
jgi:hypothetical protein